MRLVPRQLQRAGMTGTVPYYGGRLTPAQAYASSHPTRVAAPPAPPTQVPQVSQAPSRPRLTGEEQAMALHDLHESGLLTDQELADLLARVER